MYPRDPATKVANLTLNSTLGTVTRQLFLNAVCKFLDNRVGQHIAGDSLHGSAGHLMAQAICKRKREILALPHCAHFGVAHLAQGILDGLALGIQDRGF